MSSDLKLKPCPFCGGPAGFDQTDTGVSFYWDVLCDGDCPMERFTRARGLTKKAAAALWNERKPAPAKEE